MTMLYELLNLAHDLDLDEVEDRAIMRDRVAEHSRTYSTEDLLSVARSFGRQLPDATTPAARLSIIRVLGNAVTQLALQGKTEVVTSLPRPQTPCELSKIAQSWSQVVSAHHEGLDLSSFADRSIFCSRVRRSMQSMPLGTVCVLAIAHDMAVVSGDDRAKLVQAMCQQAFSTVMSPAALAAVVDKAKASAGRISA